MPGTSAPVQRVFLLMNNVWSDDRAILKESSVKALMTCKITGAVSHPRYDFNLLVSKQSTSKDSSSYDVPLECSSYTMRHGIGLS